MGRRRARRGIKNAPSVLRSLLTFSPPPFLLSAFFARQSLGMGRKFGIFGKTTTTTLSFAKRERTKWKRETTLSQSHIYMVFFVSGLDIPGIFENYIFLFTVDVDSFRRGIVDVFLSEPGRNYHKDVITFCGKMKNPSPRNQVLAYDRV